MMTRVSLVTLMCLAVAGPQTPRAQTPDAPAACPEMASALAALIAQRRAIERLAQPRALTGTPTER